MIHIRIMKITIDSLTKMTPEEILNQYSPDPTPDTVRLTIEHLLPILNVQVPRKKKKQWIRNAVDIVGAEKFVYDGALLSEHDRLKRNLWYHNIIEQVNIMNAYHRLEKHKIDGIKKLYERQRKKLIAKIAAAKINDEDTVKQSFWTTIGQSNSR